MKKQHVKLTGDEREKLQELLSKGDLKVRVQKRAMGLQMKDFYTILKINWFSDCRKFKATENQTIVTNGGL